MLLNPRTGSSRISGSITDFTLAKPDYWLDHSLPLNRTICTGIRFINDHNSTDWNIIDYYKQLKWLESIQSLGFYLTSLWKLCLLSLLPLDDSCRWATSALFMMCLFTLPFLSSVVFCLYHSLVYVFSGLFDY